MPTQLLSVHWPRPEATATHPTSVPIDAVSRAAPDGRDSDHEAAIGRKAYVLEDLLATALEYNEEGGLLAEMVQTAAGRGL